MHRTATTTKKKLKLYEFILEQYNELSSEMLPLNLCTFFLMLGNQSIITPKQEQQLKKEIDAFMASKKIELGDKWPIDSLTCWSQYDKRSRIEYLQNKIAELKKQAA